MNPVKGHEFEYFYKTLFSERVACVVLGALATHMGRFEYWQREFAIGWGDNRWNRRHICHDWRDALRLLRKECRNINLGGIFSLPDPAGASQAAALTPYDLAAAPKSDQGPGPRDWERKHVWHEGCGSPMGELVIDVDLDDQLDGMYNRTGICGCAGQKRVVCARCWHVFMDPAQLALELLLAHFGIKQYLVYFSGRRGIHFMLLDPWILYLTNGERARVMESLNQPPTQYSPLGRAMYELLAPFVEREPVLRARCLNAMTGALDYDAVMREVYPKMDVPVGADASHLHGVPLTLHPETGVLRIPIGSARDERVRFSYEHHRFDVDALTRDTGNIMWGSALRILSVLLGPDSTTTPSEWMQQALAAEGGRIMSKSEALN